jgi:hypothetical protein
VITSQRDVTAPRLTHARLTPKKIRVARKGATISRRRGAKLSFDLSESAAVTVTVIKQKGAKRLSPSVPLAAPAGRTKRGFSGRLAGRPLKRGRYKLLIEAVDTAGNAATPQTVRFRIVR